MPRKTEKEILAITAKTRAEARATAKRAQEALNKAENNKKLIQAAKSGNLNQLKKAAIAYGSGYPVKDNSKKKKAKKKK